MGLLFLLLLGQSFIQFLNVSASVGVGLFLSRAGLLKCGLSFLHSCYIMFFIFLYSSGGEASEFVQSTRNINAPNPILG